MEEITIKMEEYKELLIIKGRYEELKNQLEESVPKLYRPNYPLTREFNEKEYDFKPIKTVEPIPESPYKIICSTSGGLDWNGAEMGADEMIREE